MVKAMMCYEMSMVASNASPGVVVGFEFEDGFREVIETGERRNDSYVKGKTCSL
jgi:hypothetical protein